MSKITKNLLDEHRDIEKLLHILEQELEIFDRGWVPMLPTRSPLARD